MGRVVVDGAHDHAARPGSDPGERCAFKVSSRVTGFHVLHFAMFSIRDPGGKDAQLAEFSDGRNAAEFETGVLRALLDADWKVGKHRGSDSRPIRAAERNTFVRKGYHGAGSERLSRGSEYRSIDSGQ